MRIKRLELQGFKSFKDKTVIHFNQPITGIVGPNGCGKSNIVDAFFWVMGEQSYKHMRGEGSTDLIFNGSEKFTPLGLAESTLVMEKFEMGAAPAGASVIDSTPEKSTQKKEVAITRRVYRDGHGEYFINGVSCRLKDIHELFMDTGLGTKGYSVIEQGQIARVVNAKPEERRHLIEEAAGIAKFKARKKESVRKIESTRENISRVSNILQEIERSLASLEKQAQKARLHEKYRGELVEKELVWTRRKLRELALTRDSVHQKKAAAEEGLQSTKLACATLETELATLQSDIALLAENYEGAVAESGKIRDLETRKAAGIETAKAQLRGFDATDGQARAEIQAIQAQIGSDTEALSILEKEQLGLEALVSNETHALRELDESYAESMQSLRAIENSSKALESELLEIIQERSSLQARREGAIALSNSLEISSSDLENQTNAQSQKHHQRQLDLDALEERHQEICQQANETEKSVAELKERIRSLELNVLAAKTLCEEERATWLGLEKKHEALIELEKAYAGFSDCTKSLLLNSRGALSSLVDFLEVAPGYEKIAQAWLGSQIENLVAQEFADLDEIFKIFSTLDSGRVTVHRISSAVDEDTRALPATFSLPLEPLSNFVRVKRAFSSPALTEKLSRTYLVDQLDLNAEYPANFIFLDRSLRILDSTTGELHFESPNQSSSSAILQRRSELHELSARISAAKAKLTFSETKLEALQGELVDGRALLETKTAQYQQALAEKRGFEREKDHFLKSLQESRALLGLYEEKLQTQLQSLEKARQQIHGCEQLLIAIQGRESQTREALKLLLREVQDAQNQTAIADARRNEAKIDATRHQEQLVAIGSKIASLRAIKTERENVVREKNQSLESLVFEKKRLSESLTAWEGELSELTRSASRSLDKVNELKTLKSEAELKVSQIFESLRLSRNEIDTLSSTFSQAEVQLSQVEGEIEFTKRNAQEKYGPDCLTNPAPDPIQEEMEYTPDVEEKLREEVEWLRERLRRLGDVNPLAIQEHDETLKRYQTLQNELLELEKSIGHLEAAIDHINKTSLARFHRTFESIRTQFEKLFPILFEGGKAHLELIFADGVNDPLEAGVEIAAQPPGKSVNSISLLSGGEKALTAVALIFSIFLVKPSPFCILDEVDAPLDDINIGKFNALLREMSKNTQFILITHNKKTMELNDVLYGVTMEQPGVSKLVSVQLQ